MFIDSRLLDVHSSTVEMILCCLMFIDCFDLHGCIGRYSMTAEATSLSLFFFADVAVVVFVAAVSLLSLSY